MRLSEVLAGLSHALDITEGQPAGHAERTTLIGMALAEAAGLPQDGRPSLFHALVLKDAGCSSNAAKVAALYGADDSAVKRDRKLTDHHQPGQSIRHLLRSTAPGGTPLAKVRHLKALVQHGAEGSRALHELRCERGAQVAGAVGLDADTQDAIRHLDEHWDGRGYPSGVAGEEIPVGGRVVCLAQTMEVFWALGGRDAACAVARERRGTWFDPMLVDAVDTLERDAALWAALSAAEPDLSLVEPEDRALEVTESALDRVAEAFAMVVDAKSPYTGTHSAGVADIADGLASALGLDALERRELRRAALLHDIGKLGVSNRILDKPGKLTDEEFTAVKRHPELTYAILGRIPALAPIAQIAASHHERLDGSGYWRGLRGAWLSRPARILAVADVAEALSADRPYRGPLPIETVLEIIQRDAGRALDADAVDALAEVLPHHLRLRTALAVAA